ncbi:MAG: Peptidoglycan-N-acetylglucosamine deacetylase [Bacteroidota bacterium]|jgi:peptidoglycan/xylan/chitin deacetylase (PgdA/CDA1 family)
MSFWVKTNRLVKILFPNYIWDIPNNENKVYLTFDDGPTPEITEWVLDQLQQFNAKATFFCIGQNIEKHPAICQRIAAAGHTIGNHTFNHLKGWKTTTSNYIENVILCNSKFTYKHSPFSSLFRPPYGKIKNSQAKALRKLGFKIIMWDVISMDFDQEITSEQCLNNVLRNVTSGSIVVFHDSAKATKHLKYTLPKTLAFLKEKGLICEPIVFDKIA